jgi:hypothetical protein
MNILPKEERTITFTNILPKEGMTITITNILPKEGMTITITNILPQEGMTITFTNILPQEGRTITFTNILPQEGRGRRGTVGSLSLESHIIIIIAHIRIVCLDIGNIVANPNCVRRASVSTLVS